MKKNTRFLTSSVTFALALLVASSIAPQVLALKIDINSSGVASFYQDVVLGREDDRESSEHEREQEQERESRESEREQEHEQETRMEQVEVEHESEPFKSTSLRTKSLRVEPQGDSVRVEIRDRDSQKDSGTFERVETMQTQRLEMTAPAAATELQKKAAELKREEEKQNLEKSQESKIKAQELSQEREKNVVQNRNEYQQKIQEERDQRQGELLEIKNHFDDVRNEQTLKFASRDVSATIHEGSQLSYDPETNHVRLVTPSGEEHTLTHLPDQAISRMREAGVLSDETPENLEVITNDDGAVVYRAQQQENKKFLGLFPRQIEKSIELDDTTGEITEVEDPASTAFSRFLDNLSF